MWSEGVFNPVADGLLMAAALVLCLVVAWRQARRLGEPRFRGAVPALWIVAAVGLPLPAYFACAIGLWSGAMLFEEVGLPTVWGAAVGWVVFPPLLCLAVLSLLATLLTRRARRSKSQAA
jgi:hypothetical protein